MHGLQITHDICAHLVKSRKAYAPGCITIRLGWELMGVRKLAELATISTSTCITPCMTEIYLHF